MNLKIQPAVYKDLKEVVNLLSVNQLPTIDINEDSVQLFIGLINNKLIGTIGIEKYGRVGLLRSLAVTDEFKNQKIGQKLIKYLFDYCAIEQIEQLYLLTTTAEKYFEKFEFQKVDRLKVSDIITQTREFKDICPLSAVVMVKIFK